MKRPFDIPAELYPFESHWMEIQDIVIHYLDVGTGPDTILFCHGNPTYSLLYAPIIAQLQHRFRCIALDYPGFGMSGKPAVERYGYKPADHSEVLFQFVQKLDLKSFSIFVQDWGGPIGLGMAGRLPDRIKYLFIGNTWAWPFDADTEMGRASGQFSEKMGGEHMRRRILDKNAFVSFAMPLLLRGIRKRSPEFAADLKKAYMDPFPTPESRLPTGIFPHEIIHSHDFLETVAATLHSLVSKPTLLFWGMQDKVFPPAVQQEWERLLEDYESVPLPQTSHFFPEEEPQLIADEILAFFRSRSV